MEVDVRGRVGNTVLPHRKALYPLYEAIVNSIHAIQQRGSSDGRIDVRIVRDSSQPSLGEEVNLAPIETFEVTDNGIGFTDENFESFKTCDSRYKMALGAKGIGRLLWLRAFGEVKVESDFIAGEKRFRRTFDFRLTKDGVENPALAETKNGAANQTRVQLLGFLPKYQDACPKKLETIALKTLDHCLVYLTQAACPRIVVSDEAESFVLNDVYEERMAAGRQDTTVAIKGRDFRILNLRVHKPEEPRHRLYLCAQSRAVVEENLATHIPDITRRLTEAGGETFFVSSYVSGSALDEWVNPERTAFTLPEEADLLTSEISVGDIRRAAVDNVRKYIAPELKDLAKEKRERIEQFVRTKQPKYRTLIRHNPEVMDEIPPGLTDEKLELELHRAKAGVEAQLKAECAKVMQQEPTQMGELELIAGKFNALFEKVNAFGKAELADYIVHRRLILSLLRKRLELGDTGKYSLEEAVHKVIFPLRTTSDDIDFQEQNLWIIDEKLAYHRYLASDKPLQSMDEVVQVDSTKEPDLIIFDNPLAVAEGDLLNFSAIVIIEFKRPARNDASEGKNPIRQVYEYIDRIREGRAIDAHGKPIQVSETLPIYAFVIADITSTMLGVLKDYDFAKSPDGRRFFDYSKSRMVYVEVISYQKLVSDAEQRNRILFDKLQLPP